jgi:UDP-N-acetylmuramyl pentapeptide phosphotransferase/UDP-N-acetylglucosamine-1-phosphate transferase
MCSAVFWKVAISFVTAFVSTWFIYGWVLNFAIKYGIVDNPDARKLQRVPVPVLGGITVFVGILIVTILGVFFLDTKMLTITVIAMTVMLIIGTIDDAKGLSPAVRFIFEIGVVLYVIYLGDIKLGDFYRLWGVRSVPDYFCVPLTVFASVGIMNAINLIDGVDGYSSGFGAMACSVFAIMFYALGNQTMMIIAVAAAGALIPFFLHNVFGRKSKMFIGDGGTLLMGTIMALFVMSILTTTPASTVLMLKGVGLIPFTLAVLAVPVFDTLRVMLARIINGLPPFRPDKLHLHHLFIEMGFSHVGTTVCLILTDFSVVVVWFLSYKLGASINLQLYIVLALALLVTFGFYQFVRVQQRRNSAIYRWLLQVGEASHVERKGFWDLMRRLMDRKMEK